MKFRLLQSVADFHRPKPPSAHCQMRGPLADKRLDQNPAECVLAKADDSEQRRVLSAYLEEKLVQYNFFFNWTAS